MVWIFSFAFLAHPQEEKGEHATGNEDRYTEQTVFQSGRIVTGKLENRCNRIIGSVWIGNRGKQSADGVDFRHYKRCPLSVFSESAESDQRRNCKKHSDSIWQVLQEHAEDQWEWERSPVQKEFGQTGDGEEQEWKYKGEQERQK